jgi:hypothetical protein
MALVARWPNRLLLLASLIGAACGGDEAASPRMRGSVAGMSGGDFGNVQQPGSACAAGQSLACFCPDGTQSGSQTCSADGQLGACQGCRTQLGPVMEEGPTRDGALCSMLAGQAGCTDQSFRSEELPASILFLVDRSGSMLCNLPEAGQTSEECEAKAETKDPAQPTKWALTVAALENVLAELVDSGASVGLSFFSNDAFCGAQSLPTVEVGAMDAARASRMNEAFATVTPAGGTPIVGSTILAYSHLHEEAGLDASGGCAQPPCGAAGNRFVVLITDGADSCPMAPIEGVCGGGACTDHLLDTSVLEAARVNIRTFVIGAPGSEPARGFLSELALRGGTGKNSGACTGDRASENGDCHFDMTTSTDFAADLAAALEAISGSALGCEFPVPQPEGAAPSENVNVQVRAGGDGEPMCFGFDEGPCDGGANGWQFAKLPDGSKDLSKVVLCGDACRAVQNDPRAQVDVVLGCTPLVVD